MKKYLDIFIKKKTFVYSTEENYPGDPAPLLPIYADPELPKNTRQFIPSVYDPVTDTWELYYFKDVSGLAVSNVRLQENRNLNIAREVASGIDANASYQFDAGSTGLVNGMFHFNVNYHTQSVNQHTQSDTFSFPLSISNLTLVTNGWRALSWIWLAI